MHFLGVPPEAEDDDAVLESILKTPPWPGHATAWRAAYAAYRANSGNPHAVAPMGLGKALADAQYSLYDNRRSGRALKSMRRRRLPCCPVCGSPQVPSSLDHYLPRKYYPEFSILRLNLVSACGACNSDEKGTTVAGTDPARFVHPYFDVWLREPLWRVEIVRPLRAATFQAVPMPGLPADRHAIVTFHLENVLGDVFDRTMESEWARYPDHIVTHQPKPSFKKRRRYLERELELAIRARGPNAWASAFLRGVLFDQEATTYLCCPDEEILRSVAAN